MKWTSKPRYISQKIFDNAFVARLKSKVTLKLNKSAHDRMCIFVLSRVLIYEFHYDYVKNEYGNNSRQLFTVTDSLMYEIKTNDVSEDFGTNKELFDFGNYFAN